MTKPFLRTTFPLIASLALATGVAAAAGPLTPLGQWMKPNMGAPLAGQDFPTLQTNSDVVAGKQPSADYPQWTSFAKAVGAAAAKKDIAAVKAACKQCHDTYKEKYKKEFPTKAFP
jgi:cytochrome c553